MNAIVWIDSWQMQCCGERFSEGSRVSWTVVDPDTDWLAPLIGSAQAAAVTHAEEHHTDDGLSSIEGVVQTIRAVHYKMAPKPNENPRYVYPVEGSTKVLLVRSADGWDKIEGIEFGGYLVRLGDSREQTNPGS